MFFPVLVIIICKIRTSKFRLTYYLNHFCSTVFFYNILYKHSTIICLITIKPYGRNTYYYFIKFHRDSFTSTCLIKQKSYINLCNLFWSNNFIISTIMAFLLAFLCKHHFKSSIHYRSRFFHFS